MNIVIREINNFMKTVNYECPSLTFEEFAGLYDLTLEIHERYDYKKDNLKRYYVHFSNAAIKGDNIFYHETGNGNTIMQAINNYKKQISNQYLVFGGYGKNRLYIKVPKLIKKK